MHQVFISYAREDVKVAQRLSRDLRAAGFLPWLDLERLKPGRNWQDDIAEALRNSRFALIIISKNSLSKRGYIQKEIHQALELLDEFPDSQGFLVPVLVEPCEVKHPRLAKIQWVELFPSYEEGLDRIVSTLRDQAESEDVSLPPDQHGEYPLPQPDHLSRLLSHLVDIGVRALEALLAILSIQMLGWVLRIWSKNKDVFGAIIPLSMSHVIDAGCLVVLLRFAWSLAAKVGQKP